MTHEVDDQGNEYAIQGITKCECGCTYWEFDLCNDCGLHARYALRKLPASLDPDDQVR